MGANEDKTIRRAECSVCSGLRNCDVRGHFSQSGGDGHYDWHTAWYILQCRGCDHVFVQTNSTNSEDYDQDYDNYGNVITVSKETITYWPGIAKRERPSWMHDYGVEAAKVDALDDALLELYGALDNDYRLLAAIGVRTCFDIAAVVLGIEPDQTFKAKLDELVSAGHIGRVDRARLEALVEAGSASAHRGWRPRADELNTMMDVLEQFVHDGFVAPAKSNLLDAKVEKMKGGVPPRKARLTSA